MTYDNSKVTRNQGFTLSLEDMFLEKPQREVNLLRVNTLLYKKSQNFSGSIFSYSHNQIFMTRFYDFTNQRESKITEHLAPIQTIIIQMLLCLR